MLSKIINFFKIDIWRIRLKNLSRGKSFLIRQVRIALLALRRYDEDQCLLRASALTFFSLLSIVPVLAVAFGVAKGFGFEKILEKQLLEKFPIQYDVIGQAIGFAHTLLENTRGGLIAGAGVVLLFWSIIKVLGTIEKSFNDIWGIKAGRPLIRKFSDYLSVIFICPMLLVISSSVTIFIATQVRFLLSKISFLGILSPVFVAVLWVLPYCILWVLFTFVYLFMPNTKVNFSSAFLGGIVAGTIYQVVQWAYVTFQIGVAQYNAIYGTFAALPLFLIWLQTSWLIVLAGAEVSFAHQNIDVYEFEPDCLNVSPSHKKLIALQIVHCIVKGFEENVHPHTATQISQSLDIPIRLTRQIIFELVESGVIDEVTTHTYKETAYQPAHDPKILTIHYVITTLDNRGVSTAPVAQTDSLRVFSQSLQEFSRAIEYSPANKPLKDI